MLSYRVLVNCLEDPPTCALSNSLNCCPIASRNSLDVHNYIAIDSNQNRFVDNIHTQMTFPFF